MTDYFRIDGVNFLPLVDDAMIVNGQRTIDRANVLLTRYAAATGDRLQPVITSGFRSPEKNKSIPNAAAHSEHMQGNAVDIYDPDGLLDDWCMEQSETDGELGRIGLWLEHPSSTKGWCHLQTVQFRSWNRARPRWFYP